MVEMNYQDVHPTPAQQQIKVNNPNTTLFVSMNGEFLNLPTEAQAKKKVVAFMKNFNPDEWWAQKISRFRLGDKEYLTAYIIRDYSESHKRDDLAKDSGHQMWFGREVIGIPAKKTDDDEHSETRGQRIPLKLPCQLADGTITDLPVLDKKGYYSYTEVSPKNIEIYKKMQGMNMDDQNTECVFVLQKGGRVVSAEFDDDIFDMDTQMMRDEDRILKKAKREKEKATIEPKASKKIK